MSSTHAPSPVTASAPGGERRVREQARDAATLMAFSLATSVGAATALAVLSGLGR